MFYTDFHTAHPRKRHFSAKTEAVLTEDNVWIGNEAMLLKGVSGDNAIVRACCMVTKDVPRQVVIVANSAQVLGSVYA